MVFFTCNACGTCLKKNQVERHFGCSRNYCCMDCQKEFRGEEYKAHTKCISEAEKYNGPDWKAPSSVNKGERKQVAWVETVNSVLEKGRKSMSPKQIALLNAITQHDNVPRKKAKFLNFVKNITRNSFDTFTVDAVWDLLEAEWKRQAEANKPPPSQNGSANGQNGTANGSSNGNGAEENGDEENDAKKEKKKSKKNKRKRGADDMEEDEEVDIKKKKTGKSDDISDDPENGNMELDESSSTPTEFRWGEIITQILQSRDDHSISLKKLKKKVFSEYYARVGDTKGVKTKEDLSGQLNKKLKKKKFKLVGDNVKLVKEAN